MKFFKQYDEKGNNISRTYYESLLSKLIIENDHFVRPIFKKINNELLRVSSIFEKNPHEENYYQYYLFLDIGLHQLNLPYRTLKSFFENGTIPEFINYYKYVFESQFFWNWSAQPLIESKHSSSSFETDDKELALMDLLSDLLTNDGFYPATSNDKFSRPDIKPLPIKTLGELAQEAIKKNKHHLQAVVRPPALFTESARGRSQVYANEKNYDIGIMTASTCTRELKNKLLIGYSSAKLAFERDANALIVKHFEENDLPFISGLSGTVGFILCAILHYSENNFADLTFSPKELKMLYMGIVAGLTYEGHHSLTESMMIFKTIGFPLDFSLDPKEYYEQLLTNEFKESSIYANFLAKFNHSPPSFQQASVVIERGFTPTRTWS